MSDGGDALAIRMCTETLTYEYSKKSLTQTAVPIRKGQIVTFTECPARKETVLQSNRNVEAANHHASDSEE